MFFLPYNLQAAKSIDLVGYYTFPLKAHAQKRYHYQFLIVSNYPPLQRSLPINTKFMGVRRYRVHTSVFCLL